MITRIFCVCDLRARVRQRKREEGGKKTSTTSRRDDSHTVVDEGPAEEQNTRCVPRHHHRSERANKRTHTRALFARRDQRVMGLALSALLPAPFRGRPRFPRKPELCLLTVAASSFAPSCPNSSSVDLPGARESSSSVPAGSCFADTRRCRGRRSAGPTTATDDTPPAEQNMSLVRGKRRDRESGRVTLCVVAYTRAP